MSCLTEASPAVDRGSWDSTSQVTKKLVTNYHFSCSDSGYMSPEYAMHGNFSTKSDVFSFGVLVLEIISRGGARKIFKGGQTSKNKKSNTKNHFWGSKSEFLLKYVPQVGDDIRIFYPGKYRSINAAAILRESVPERPWITFGFMERGCCLSFPKKALRKEVPDFILHLSCTDMVADGETEGTERNVEAI
ncbi:hypothetical protein LXL04_010101 [Taraxacum kok-saghyz]